jgi:single-strand DNA-binding protein
MANYNRVLLMGNLTRNPQLRYTPSQQPVCEFGIAINRKWKGQDGQQHDEATFVDCTAWGRSAETICKYLTKGSPLFVDGRLTYRQWDGPDGKKKSKLEVTVMGFQFLGGPRGGGPGAAGASAERAAPSAAPADDAKRQETSGQANQGAAPSEYDYSQDLDDDTIPF